MQKLLIALGMDLSDWKDGVSKAKKEYHGLVKDVKSGLSTVGIGTVAVAGSMTALFGMTEMVSAHSKIFETLQTKTRAADSEMKSLKEDVYDLNTALGLRSVSEAADKMGMVAKMSRTTGDELKQLTYQTGLLGKEFGDEEEQLQAQVAIMKAYKASVGEAGDVVAFLNKQGGDLKGELLESIKEYSVQFSEAGFSLNQTVAVLKEGLSQGWNVDKAADAFKEGRLRLMGGDKATVDALAMLGLGDLDSQIKSGLVSIPQAMGQIQGELSKLNKTEQFRIAKEIFGAQYEDVGSVAMTAMLSGMNKQMKTTGAIDLMTKSLHDRFSYKWDASVSRLTNSFSRMIEDLKPHILPAIEWFGDLTESISDFSRRYGNIVKTIGAGIVAFALLAGVLGIVSVAAGVFGIVMAIVTSPLTLILLGVVAVAAGMIWLEQKTGFLTRAWNTLANAGSAVWNELGLLWDELAALFPELDSLKEGLSFGDVAKAFEMVFDQFIMTSIRASMSVFKGLLKVVRSLVGLFKDGFNQEDIDLMFEGLSDIFIEPIKLFFNNDLTKLFLDTISGWGDSLYDSLMSPVNKIRNSKIGRALGWGTDDTAPKISARNIRGQSPAAESTGQTASGWSVGGLLPGTQTAQPSQDKRTIVQIQNYHSNSRNAAADWSTLGQVAK